MTDEKPIDGKPDSNPVDAHIREAEIADAEVSPPEIVEAEIVEAEIVEAEIVEADLVEADLVEADIVEVPASLAGGPSQNSQGSKASPDEVGYFGQQPHQTRAAMPVRQSKRTGNKIAVFFLLLIGLGGVCGFVLLVISAANEDLAKSNSRDFVIADDLFEIEYSTEEIKEGFPLEPSVSSEEEAEQIRTLLESTYLSDSGTKFRDIVDTSAFVEHARNSPFGGALYEFEVTDLENEAHLYANQSKAWDRLVVQSTNKTFDGSTIVYVHAIHTNGSSNPLRFWIKPGPVGYQVTDWQLVEMGMRASEKFAIFLAYDEPGEDMRLAFNNMSMAQEFFQSEERDAAMRVLADIAPKREFRLVHDHIMIHLAYTYMEWLEYDAVIRTVHRVQRPHLFPGVPMLLGDAYHGLGRSDLAERHASNCIERFGYQPQAIRVLAATKHASGKFSQAQRRRLQVLQIVKSDDDLLRAYATHLKDTESDKLEDILLKQQDPQRAAYSLAPALSNNEWHEGLVTIKELLRRREPNTARLAVLYSMINGLENDWKASTPILRPFVNREMPEEIRQEIHSHFLRAMLEEGKIDEAVSILKNKDFAFNFVMDLFDEGELDWSTQRMLQFLTTFVEARKDHKIAQLRLVEFCFESGEIGRARIELAKAKKLAGKIAENLEEAKPIQRYIHRTLMNLEDALYVMDGKWVSRYEQDPNEETFRRIADLYEPTESEAQSKQFDELLALHRRKYPDDQFVVYFQALADYRKGNRDRAKELLTKLVENEENHDVPNYLLVRLWNALHVSNKSYRTALKGTPQFQSTFRAVVGGLKGKGEYEQLTDILDSVLQTEANTVPIQRARSQIAFARKDYAQVLEIYAKRAQYLAERGANRTQDFPRLLLLRTYLRLGEIRNAETIAADLEDDDRQLADLLIAVKKNDVDAALRVMKKASETPYLLERMYSDDDLIPLRSDLEYESVRRAVPDPWMLLHGPMGVVLHSARPSDFRVMIESILKKELGPNCEIASLPDSHDGKRQYVVGRAGESVIAITMGSGHAWSFAQRLQSMPDSSVAKVRREHTSWTAVTTSYSTDHDAQRFRLCRVLAALTGDESLGVQVEDRFVKNRKGWRERLAEGPHQAELVIQGSYFEEEIQPTKIKQPPARERQATLTKIEEAFLKGDQKARIEIQLAQGAASERVWLQVVDVIHPGYRQRSFVAQMQDDSKLIPRLKRGAYLRVYPHEIIGSKLE